jgi:hypothetical protein
VSAHLHTAALGRYVSLRGHLREIVALPGHAGSLLVLDCDAVTHGDRRLVAHLAADEPRANALVICRDYLRNPERRCRALSREDLKTTPSAGSQLDGPGEFRKSEAIEPFDRGAHGGGTGEPFDRDGHTYRLSPVSRGVKLPELRWQRLPAEGSCDELPEPLCVREVIGALESYQPVRALTARALASKGEDPDISTSTLRAELERVNSSHIVLNRGLREAVLAAVGKQDLTMSEITLRCGRFKRDARGNRSGDTSWLARRIGLLPEGGRGRRTPWVHSDVLALIARQGLGISPREVELG